MFVPWVYLNGRHLFTLMYNRGAEDKICQLTIEAERSGSETLLMAYGQSLSMMDNLITLEHFGNPMMITDHQW